MSPFLTHVYIQNEREDELCYSLITYSQLCSLSVLSMYRYPAGSSYGMSTELVVFVHWRLSPAQSPAKETVERRLGRGRKPAEARLRCGDCGVGDSALRAHVPLCMAPPTRTSVPILEAPLPRDAAEGGEAGLLWPWPWQVGDSCLRLLCLLQRNEPGWFVGEHIQD
jgi:hypothetical protein